MFLFLSFLRPFASVRRPLFFVFGFFFPLQVKYKEAGRKEAGSSLYHQLPETLETQRVKEVTELQSEVQASVLHMLNIA